MNSTTKQRVNVADDVALDVSVSGPPSGPAIVLVHGFPESSHSWRHQIPVLADLGYHVIVPDMRGYAGSSKPDTVASYGIDHLTGDLLALLDHFGHDDAVFVGHDWGALITWDLARLHPTKVRALVNVSVPFVDWPAPPLTLFRAINGDNFFYIVYFQDVGPVERELDHQAERFLRTILWAASGDGWRPDHPTHKAAGNGWLDTLPEPPSTLAPWCLPEDLATYTRQFSESGFFGPCSYYRNMDANYERVRHFPVSEMTMPTAFIGGTKDMVIARDLNGLNRMSEQLPNYLGHVLIEGAGHWTQQERPQEFNDALFGFLHQIGKTAKPL